MELTEEMIERVVLTALEEDVGDCDITTESIIPKDVTAKADIIAKEDGILCGIYVAEKVFLSIENDIKFDLKKCDGDKIQKGDIIATIEAKARTILTCERVALNFLQRMSGIATKTQKYVLAVEGTDTKILDTRKTTPGLRAIERYAVKTGGAENHRMGLYDMVLIKDNHMVVAKSITDAVNMAAQAHPDAMVEVEVETFSDFLEAIEAQPDMIMLDNMDLKLMKKCILKNSEDIILEASGGINLETVREVAQLGVDCISVGRLTHFVESLDISVDFHL